jgi:hypothetical protein
MAEVLAEDDYTRFLPVINYLDQNDSIISLWDTLRKQGDTYEARESRHKTAFETNQLILFKR